MRSNVIVLTGVSGDWRRDIGTQVDNPARPLSLMEIFVRAGAIFSLVHVLSASNHSVLNAGRIIVDGEGAVLTFLSRYCVSRLAQAAR